MPQPATRTKPTKATYQDPHADTLHFIRSLAEMPEREGTIDSRAADKAKAFSFRRRLYWWRRRVADALGIPDSPEAIAARQWLVAAFGPRATKTWLDLTYFRVECVDEDRDRWVVRGGVNFPMSGPDIEFMDSDSMKENIAMVEAMLARKVSGTVAPASIAPRIENAGVVVPHPSAIAVPRVEPMPLSAESDEIPSTLRERIVALAREAQIPVEPVLVRAAFLRSADASDEMVMAILGREFA